MKRQSRNKARTERFELELNGHRIVVNATPYLVNGEETRFRVSYNGSPVYIFARADQHLSLMESKESVPPFIAHAIAARLEQLEARRAA